MQNTNIIEITFFINVYNSLTFIVADMTKLECIMLAHIVTMCYTSMTYRHNSLLHK